jgi:hypothetical protein
VAQSDGGHLRSLRVEKAEVIRFHCASDRSAALCGDEAGDLVLPWS